jgi:hypothetical protein
VRSSAGSGFYMFTSSFDSRVVGAPLVKSLFSPTSRLCYEPRRRFSGAAAMVPCSISVGVPAAAAVAADRLALLVRQRFHLAV